MVGNESVKEDTREENDRAMKNALVRYAEQVVKEANTIKDYKMAMKRFEESRFVTCAYKKYYLDIKVHFLQRIMAKEFSMKYQSLSSSSSTFKNASDDMTVFQVVPSDLHGTYFFKVFQTLMKDPSIQDQVAILKQVKHALHTIIFFENNDMAASLNSGME